MYVETNLLLGLPIQNLNMKEVVKSIHSMVDEYKKDRKPRQIATVNVDFLVNTLGWIPGTTRHPELLNILRNADLLTPDGMPIVWSSRFLGNKLKERVPGIDLVYEIAEMASNQGISLFLLGGSSTVGETTKNKLNALFPNLDIKGTLAPNVTVEIERIVDTSDQDKQIVEYINKCNPDILLIAFGNPKQELWYARNKHLIKVPVSIGVGGSFEFIAGTVKRAPTLIQKVGLEWIFRLAMEPKRLWKRYLIGLFKFSFMILPTIGYQLYRMFLLHLANLLKLNNDINIKEPIEYDTKGVKILKLPHVLNAQKSKEISKEIDELLMGEENINLDFSNVFYIDASFMGYFISTYNRARKLDRYIYLAGLNNYVVRYMKLNRIWDIFEPESCSIGKPSAISKNSYDKKYSFSFKISKEKDYAVLTMSGSLDITQLSTFNLDSVTKNMGGGDCIIDLEKLQFVDSFGLTCLLQIHRDLISIGKRCVICSLQKNVRQMFSIFKIDRSFNISKDLISAKKTFEANT